VFLTDREKLQLKKPRKLDQEFGTKTCTNYYVNLEDGDIYNVKLHKQQQAKRSKELLVETRIERKERVASWLYNYRTLS
jgi:hypothetical protein